MHRQRLAVLTVCIAATWSVDAVAFCGLYISTEKDAELLNEAAQIVMMRQGTHTAVTVQNSYRGPARDFAMLVPVPQAITQDDIWVVEPRHFSRLIRYTSPRLIEYVAEPYCRGAMYGGGNKINVSGVGSAFEPDQDLPVSVKAELSMSEYELAVLESDDSEKLLEWLEMHGYAVREDTEALLGNYIEQGMQFLVIEVAIDRVKLDEEGRATLSPLHFSYRSEDFSLPMRPGRLGARGPQELILHVISDQGRVEVTDHPSVIMPTNLIISHHIRHQFAQFYSALVEHVMTLFDVSIITEYAATWPGPESRSCNPCTTSDTRLPTELFLALGVPEQHQYSWQPEAVTTLIGFGREGQDVRLDSSSETACYGRWLEAHGLSTSAHQLTQRITYEPGEEGEWARTRFEHTSSWYPPGFVLSAFPDCKPGWLDYQLMRHGTGKERVVVETSYAHRLLPDEQAIGTRDFTLTRLRARFSPEQELDDLVLTHAPGLRGGFGRPFPGKREMRFFYEVDAHGEKATRSPLEEVDLFQVRHMILDDAKVKKHKCEKGLYKAFDWGPSRYITPGDSSKTKPLPEESTSWVENAREASLLPGKE